MRTRILSAIAAGITLVAAGPASAWENQSGDWLFSVTGTVNGFYVYRTVNDGVNPKTSNSAVENGLLPAWINFQMSTQIDGWDVKAHIGLAPGINDKSTIVGLPEHADPSTGLSPFSQIDTRNAYLSFGNAGVGKNELARTRPNQPIIINDVEVKCARSPALSALAPRRPFNCVQPLQQREWRKVRLYPRNGIHKIRLVRLAKGSGPHQP